MYSLDDLIEVLCNDFNGRVCDSFIHTHTGSIDTLESWVCDTVASLEKSGWDGIDETDEARIKEARRQLGALKAL